MNIMLAAICYLIQIACLLSLYNIIIYTYIANYVVCIMQKVIANYHTKLHALLCLLSYVR